jgi:putative endonuclease
MIAYKYAKARHIRLGRRGESIAAAYLRACGIEVLLRNYRYKRGEIDIVARDGAIICFVEVKTRWHTTRSRPAEGLSESQKKRISHTASAYLRVIGNPKVVYRFDLIEIVVNRWDVRELRYWRSHFSGGRIT